MVGFIWPHKIKRLPTFYFAKSNSTFVRAYFNSRAVGIGLTYGWKWNLRTNWAVRQPISDWCLNSETSRKQRKKRFFRLPIDSARFPYKASTSIHRPERQNPNKSTVDSFRRTHQINQHLRVVLTASNYPGSTLVYAISIALSPAFLFKITLFSSLQHKAPTWAEIRCTDLPLAQHGSIKGRFLKAQLTTEILQLRHPSSNRESALPETLPGLTGLNHRRPEFYPKNIAFFLYKIYLFPSSIIKPPA